MRQRLHLAHALEHLFELAGDELEAFPQALFQRALQLFVDGAPHLLELLGIVLPQALEPTFHRQPQGLVRGGAVLGEPADLAGDAVEPLLLAGRAMLQIAAEPFAEAADRRHQRFELVGLHRAEPRHGAVEPVAEGAHRGLQLAALLPRAERRLVAGAAEIVRKPRPELGDVAPQLVQRVQHQALARTAPRPQQRHQREKGREARQPDGVPERVDRHHAFRSAPRGRQANSWRAAMNKSRTIVSV